MDRMGLIALWDFKKYSEFESQSECFFFIQIRVWDKVRQFKQEWEAGRGSSSHRVLSILSL